MVLIADGFRGNDKRRLSTESCDRAQNINIAMNAPSLPNPTAFVERRPLTLSWETSVQEAAMCMAQAGADCVFAVDRTNGTHFRGVFSARHLVSLVASGTDLTRCLLREAIATTHCTTVGESEIEDFEAVRTAFHHSGREIPVVGQEGELVGAIALERWIEAIISSFRERQLVNLQLQTSQQQMRALIENIHDIVLAIEAEGNAIEVLPTSPALLYNPETDLIGQTLEQFFRPECAETFVKPVREVINSQQVLKFEYSLVVNDNCLWFDACISPLSERSVLWIARDITQRKRAEVEVLKALEQARELNELKSRFVSMTSHEFRTPLTAIQSSAQLLQRYDWSRPEQERYFQQIQSAVQQMVALMEDMLMLGKAEAGKLQFDPQWLELLDFCRRLVSQVQLASGKHHRLNLRSRFATEELWVDMDKKLLRHILGNLLTNAIAYSPTDSTIQLTLNLEPGGEDGDSIIFEVKDSGIGIPLEAQSRLFESFYRASNVGSIRGTGLGLTIVKHCVELHRGTIGVESQVGVGTAFQVILPSTVTSKQ